MLYERCAKRGLHVIPERVYSTMEKRKLLFWEESSKKAFKEFPIPVQKDMGVALFIAQLG